MARALDHLVLPSRDLAGLAEIYRRLGFTVGRRNRHPWGTENHIVQFDGVFLELLGFADNYVPVSADNPAAAFTSFIETAPDGIGMLVLHSDDAARDAQAFEEAGIGWDRLLPFSRSAQGPDGSDRSVAFTVAFAQMPTMPEVGAFVCQHHRPENFWNRDAQRHANGAMGVASVTIVAERPSDHIEGLGRFVAQSPLSPRGAGFEFALEGSRLEVVTPAEWRSRYGVEVPEARDAFVAGMTIRVRDLSATGTVLEAGDIPYDARADRLVVGPSIAGGALVAFVRDQTGPNQHQAEPI